MTDDDLRRALLDHEPEIVHFCGHGSNSEGLAFEDDTGEAQNIPGEALAGLFKLCANHVRCVLLNACYSETQADAVAEHIEYVVGMKREIGDEAAIKFAIGFYDALGAGRSFEDAFEFGKNAIDLKKIPEYTMPILKKAVRNTQAEGHYVESSLVRMEANVLRGTERKQSAIEVLVENRSDQELFIRRATLFCRALYAVCYASEPPVYAYSLDLELHIDKMADEIIPVDGIINEPTDEFGRPATGYVAIEPYHTELFVTFPMYLKFAPQSSDLVRFIIGKPKISRQDEGYQHKRAATNLPQSLDKAIKKGSEAWIALEGNAEKPLVATINPTSFLSIFLHSGDEEFEWRLSKHYSHSME